VIGECVSLCGREQHRAERAARTWRFLLRRPAEGEASARKGSAARTGSRTTLLIPPIPTISGINSGAGPQKLGRPWALC